MSADGRDEPSDGSAGEAVPASGDTDTGGPPPEQTPSLSGPGSTAASAGPPAPPAKAPPGPSVPTQRAGGAGTRLSAAGEASRADADLITRMRAGDDSAYETLYRRHAEAVRRYARTCCRDAHTADDLTAEVFARMLQAVRGGSGPEHAVRAYLLTTVRRVAAGWTKSARREQLVEDFAVFAAQAARGQEISDDDTLDLGADVLAMHEAEQSMAMQAFLSLPERWQAVLWHTEVEDESPSDVATLFGLDANGTRVLASRAREGLKRAYLQAHVSATLTRSEECARHADRLGAFARGGLRARAERGLRKHLEECAECRVAAGQIKDIAGGIPAVVPIAVIGWFGAAGYAKVVALVGGGAAASAGAGAASAAVGGSSGGSAAGGAAAAEGLGAPAKAGIAVGVVVAAAVAAAIALTGGGGKPKDDPPRRADGPAASESIVPQKPPSSAPKPEPAPPSAPPKPSRTPAPPAPAPEPEPPAEETSGPKPPPPSPEPEPIPPKPRPTPTPSPPSAPVVYQWSSLRYDVAGDGTGPEMRLADSSWVWQRQGLSVADTRYAHGVTVHGESSVTIDLNRSCSTYDALVGVDDMTLGIGRLRFSVYGDGVRLWRSPLISGGDPATPAHVDITGREAIRLVVEPHTSFDTVALADWAQSRLSCRG
ncbi:RNA polymerase subunit sigma-24 [Streptomyces alfalfae]|uniref:RNA polymerase subunit sigma-24 n=1 Tax=Streptomyces alfalfae TaxID=1642299 RepID=A0A1P8TIP9_9ACTN|nr:sigma-70 family RNA polymerase sigma factor [Streptomyces alfalfae]AYA17932.1 sigma-70 family RNA polymerase sigma factor [Streptomyces fradiae]APY87518.1 RNA polymerase subunit sigma-24 [Streptomyces alfalfae]QQC90156.1 sigma-70 family RNA polymerase sigma factor [Streptomyces alfalfae]QUI32571.1 sigma-70 family RNA polymerase sigma factor [Streptomyces alfalfae]RXX45143.1 RNA polymerase subunit sigma-24 [Streptomyces alfalfae]